MADMRNRGISQADIGRAFQVSQQSVSRELARYTETRHSPAQADSRDPVTFVQGFGNGLHALQALKDHYIASMDIQWRDMALATWRMKFRKHEVTTKE